MLLGGLCRRQAALCTQTCLRPVLLRTAQLELPRPHRPEMAFSGQYAAAQLEKLDLSPLFRGHTFSLAREVSGYLG